MSCRNCKLLDVPVKNGQTEPHPDFAYQCLAPIPAEPILPASMTDRGQFAWPPHKRWMTLDDGVGCPCWQSKEPENEGCLGT